MLAFGAGSWLVSAFYMVVVTWLDKYVRCATAALIMLGGLIVLSIVNWKRRRRIPHC